jgi:hypothetical protein
MEGNGRGLLSGPIPELKNLKNFTGPSFGGAGRPTGHNYSSSHSRHVGTDRFKSVNGTISRQSRSVVLHTNQ